MITLKKICKSPNSINFDATFTNFIISQNFVISSKLLWIKICAYLFKLL